MENWKPEIAIYTLPQAENEALRTGKWNQWLLDWDAWFGKS
jgi:hypothetical protein